MSGSLLHSVCYSVKRASLCHKHGIFKGIANKKIGFWTDENWQIRLRMPFFMKKQYQRNQKRKHCCELIFETEQEIFCYRI